MARSDLFLTEDARLLDGIRRGDEETLVLLYRLCDGPVRRYVAANNGTQDDADDMLQEALVILWERVREGRFEYTARLSTFVVGTVRNLWLRRLARARRESPFRGTIDMAADPGDSPLDAMIDSETMEEIASRLGFANAETAKARKYQCKKSLQQILNAYERPE
jgi:DNA-directed RNA polymerase specialized sigma24 family protein